jgi:CLIP-associating protein 1/2
MKACLRTPNQHLTAASLSTLLPLLPLIIARQPLHAYETASSSTIDSSLLRHALVAFLPSGGIIDRLGDNREKIREKARDCLVTLGGLCFQSTGPNPTARSKDGKGPETPLQLLERHLRESGLGSKVWRVREQVRHVQCLEISLITEAF